MPEPIIDTKEKLDNRLAIIDALTMDDMPTRLINGRPRKANMVNVKRRRSKRKRRDHYKELIKAVAKPLKAAGYLEADAQIQAGKIVIYLEGLPVVENP